MVRAAQLNIGTKVELSPEGEVIFMGRTFRGIDSPAGLAFLGASQKDADPTLKWIDVMDVYVEMIDDGRYRIGSPYTIFPQIASREYVDRDRIKLSRVLPSYEEGVGLLKKAGIIK